MSHLTHNLRDLDAWRQARLAARSRANKDKAAVMRSRSPRHTASELHRANVFLLSLPPEQRIAVYHAALKHFNNSKPNPDEPTT